MPLMKLDLFGAAYQDQDQDSVYASTTTTSTNDSSQQPSEAASSEPPRLLPLRSGGKLPPQQGAIGAIGGRSMCAKRSPTHEQPSELARVVQWKLELAQKKRSYHAGSKRVGGKRPLNKCPASPMMSSGSDSGMAEGERRFSAEDTSAAARDRDFTHVYDAAVLHHAPESKKVSSVEAKKMLKPLATATWVAASHVTCERGGGAERDNVARGSNSGGEAKKVADTAAAEPPTQRGNDSGNTLRRRGAMTADFLRGFWEDFAPEARTNVMALHLNGETAAQIKDHYLLVDYDLTEAAVLAIIHEDQENAKAQAALPPPLRLEQSSVESVLRAWYLPLRDCVTDPVTSPPNLSLSGVPKVDNQVACAKSKEPRELDYSVTNSSCTTKTKSPSIVMSSQPLPHHQLQPHQLRDEFHLFPVSKPGALKRAQGEGLGLIADCHQVPTVSKIVTGVTKN
jgi:hypothetical protein